MDSKVLPRTEADTAAHATTQPYWTQKMIDQYEADLIKMERKIKEENLREQEGEVNCNWHEAALAAKYAPPPVCPVVVGDRSLFKRPEDASSFFGIVDGFPIFTAIEIEDDSDLEAELIKNPEKGTEIISSKVNLPTVLICGVNLSTPLDIQFLTKGQTINIWFESQERSAWLPTSLLPPHHIPGGITSDCADKVPAAGEFPVLIGNMGGDQSMFTTVEELGSFLHLSDVRGVIQTTATSVTSDETWKSGHGRLHEQQYPSRLVAFVNTNQRRELRSRTVGRNILVWFPGNIPRYAWAPWYVNTEDQSEEIAEDITRNTANQAVDTSALGDESWTSDEWHDLKKEKEKHKSRPSPQSVHCGSGSRACTVRS